MSRIAHLSDIHFGDENAAALEAAKAWVNAGGFDLVVVSGDLTRQAETAEFRAAAAWLADIRGATLVTAGNHDTHWSDRVHAPFRRFSRWIGPAQVQTHLGPDLAVYGINTARGIQPRLNWSKGQISAAQVRRAIRWFAAAPPDALRVVVCHHPLEEGPHAPMTGRVWGGPAAARALVGAGVDLVLSGHVHAPFAVAYPVADEKTYAFGCSTLSTRERGAAPGLSLVDADETEVRLTTLGWTGSSLEPQRSWSFDRRRR